LRYQEKIAYFRIEWYRNSSVGRFVNFEREREIPTCTTMRFSPVVEMTSQPVTEFNPVPG
jgi:hypothetical protein